MQKSRFQMADFTPPGDRQPYSLDAPIMLLRRYGIALWALLAIALIVGCARQYHWYRCGCDCVNYNYCPPAPLPYTPYCSCPTPIATSYDLQAAQSHSVEGPPEGPSQLPTPDDYPGR